MTATCADASPYVGRPGISPVLVGLLQAGVIDRSHAVLEIGCGTGLDAVLLARWGCSVIGVDALARHIAAAKARAVGARVSRRTIFIKASFPENAEVVEKIARRSIDVVIDTLCWSNITAPRSERDYPRAVWRVLGRGGLFVLQFRPVRADWDHLAPPSRILPESMLRFFRWSRLIKTHLAENRSWSLSEILKKKGRRYRTKRPPRLSLDHAVVYVGIGTRLASPRP